MSVLPVLHVPVEGLDAPYPRSASTFLAIQARSPPLHVITIFFRWHVCLVHEDPPERRADGARDVAVLERVCGAHVEDQRRVVRLDPLK